MMNQHIQRRQFLLDVCDHQIYWEVVDALIEKYGHRFCDRTRTESDMLTDHAMDKFNITDEKERRQIRSRIWWFVQPPLH